MENKRFESNPDVVIVYDVDHAPHASLKIIIKEALEAQGHEVLIAEKKQMPDLKEKLGTHVAIIDLKSISEI